jgi:transposase
MDYSPETDGATAIVEPTTERTAFAGIDVAKPFFDVALWGPDQPVAVEATKRLKVGRFDRTPEGVEAFFDWSDEILGQTPRVVMESTGSYSIELIAWLVASRPASAPAMINPRTAKDYIATIDPRNSTDQIAARALARFGAERHPAPYEPPSGERSELRDLTRYRQCVVEQREAQEARLRETTHDSPMVRRILKQRIGQLRRDEKKLKQEIIRVIKASSALNVDVQLLRTIRGVDWIVAATVVAELGDLRRFGRARQLTAFAGVSPKRRTSGTSVRGKTKLVKIGSAHVRRALYLSATNAIQGDNDWAEQYAAMVASGKEKMAALGVIMRKILCAMRAIEISGRPYEAHHQSGCGQPG